MRVGQVLEASEPVGTGPDVDLEWPPSGVRHGDGERVVGDDHPVDVLGDEGAAEAALLVAAVRGVSGELGLDDRREVIERVQLAVEMAERRADQGAAVLERHHVSVALGPQRAAAVTEHSDEVDQLLPGQPGQRATRVVGRVDDDLASSFRAGHEPIVGDRCRRCERWKSVVEHRYLERPRQLRTAGAQRARIGARVDGATRPACCAPAR